MAKSSPGIHKPPPQFSPPRQGPCLCGSGLKYKRCCEERLPGTTELGRRAKAFLKEEKYTGALLACRADITQYTICHKSHTEPPIRAGMPRTGSLMDIDIAALGEIVDTLLWCHIKSERMDELPAVLERLRGNIDDERWRRRIIYVQAMHALWPDWNESAGRQELRKLGTLGTDDDVEILQLYLDLFEDSLGFAEKDALIDRILNESESLTDQLHYKGSKAVLYLTISDFKKADAELVEAVALARARLDEKTSQGINAIVSHRHWVCWDGCARTTRCCMRQWRCTKGCLPTKTIGLREAERGYLHGSAKPTGS